MKKSLAVIFGGVSSEHEISLKSSFSILSNINPDKYELHMLGITRDGRWLLYDGPLSKIRDDEWESDDSAVPAIISPDASVHGIISGEKKIHLDVILPVLHGIGGEDGTIQGLFELAGIPYVGCDVAASANCMDKALSKVLFAAAGLPQVPYVIAQLDSCGTPLLMAEKCEAGLCYPMFVKPSNTGSSIGIGKAKNREELLAAIAVALKFSKKIVVEKCIDAREIELAVMGNGKPVASCCGEVLPAREFYDFEAKYNDQKSAVQIPAELSEERGELLRTLAIKAYSAACCSGLSRVDFFIDRADNAIYLNEINTLPGFTNISMFPKLFMHCGYTYSGLIDRLIEYAAER